MDKLKLFVYGTLKRNHYNHDLLISSEFLGEFITTPDFTMYDLGAYPAVAPGGASRIQGEVYRVSKGTLSLLDQLESYPVYYNRILIVTEYGKAWIYIMEGDLSHHRIIENGCW